MTWRAYSSFWRVLETIGDYKKTPSSIRQPMEGPTRVPVDSPLGNLLVKQLAETHGARVEDVPAPRALYYQDWGQDPFGAGQPPDDVVLVRREGVGAGDLPEHPVAEPRQQGGEQVGDLLVLAADAQLLVRLLVEHDGSGLRIELEQLERMHRLRGLQGARRRRRGC